MIEILLGVWFVSFCLSMMTLIYGFTLTRKKLHSSKLQNVNANLEKVGLFWSNAISDFAPLKENAVRLDQKKTLRSALMIGLLSLGSVLGFLLLFIVTISVHFIAPSRKEKAMFRSALANDPNLTSDQVTRVVDELKQIF